MFNGIQSKECHDNNPVHSGLARWKLFPFGKINENMISNTKVINL